MDKRNIILQTALKLFVENGFHGTPTAKIALDSGVANGTLFNYFKTKDQLIVSLYFSILKEMEGFILEKMASLTLTKETFETFFSASLFWSLENPLQYQYLQQFNHSPYFHQVTSTDLKQDEQPLFVLIEKGIDIVLLKPMPTLYIFSLFTSHLNGLYSYIINTNVAENERAELINDSFELLWNMIKE